VISAAAAARTSTVVATDNSISNIPGQQELKLFNAPNLAGTPVRVFDITGRQVMLVRPVSNSINIASLPPGVYVLVYTLQGKQVTKRFVR
jgi:hypothetical protein